jgi:hypothetical protein
MTKMTELLDARDYKWERFYAPAAADNPFDFVEQRHKEPMVSVADVTFDESTLSDLNYVKNGFTGFNGTFQIQVYEHAAVLLESGKVLFCITRGYEQNDTFDEGHDVELEYYLLTKI